MKNKVALPDRVVGWFNPTRGARRILAREIMAIGGAYQAAERTRLRSDWNVLSEGPTPDKWTLDTIRDRSRQAGRNDPIANGAIDTLCVNVTGQGLRPQSAINAARAGISETMARDLQEAAEWAFKKWAENADIAGRLDFDDLQFLALTRIIEDGEVLVNLPWSTDKWRHYKRATELIEADRLVPPMDRLVEAPNGIRIGKQGEALSYFIRKSLTSGETTEVAARDADGRPRILHIYPARRAGQTRGLPWFTPILTYLKDLGAYIEAEIVTARVAACLAVFITKDDPIAAAGAMGSSTETSTGARVQTIEPAQISYLKHGENIQVVDPRGPGKSFNDFTVQMLRMIGTSLGIPYEILTKDFSKTNYSSARAALLEGRRNFIRWRKWLSKKLCQPIWETVIEEAYLRGDFKAPNFYGRRYEYTRTRWIGAGWGWVDPVKEVDSSRMAIDYGLSTWAEEAAGQGRDWEEILEQRRLETPLEKEVGIMAANKTREPSQEERIP